jgi:AmmeMemoRadiSam system protein B
MEARPNVIRVEPMPLPERPQLHSFVKVDPDINDPESVILWSRLNNGKDSQRLTLREYQCLKLFDGRRTLREMQAELAQNDSGLFLSLELFAALVQKVEEAHCLDSPRFRETLSSLVREPSCIGCYSGNPAILRHQLRQLFLDARGPGLPRETKPDGRLRAALIPHIDYLRGGVTYAWGFKEVFERTDASLFVIIGTSHHSEHRFTLTRKHFRTPLGVAQTDQVYIDRLVAHYGDGLFDDEYLAHLPEHSIELELVFLQYLYEGRRAIRIVPLVVGSFFDCVVDGIAPLAREDVARMVEALRRAEAETKESICYIISGDLAHLGPKFRDPHPVAEPLLTHSRNQDHALLRQTEAANPHSYFQVIAEERDHRRICGLPPTYLTLEALRPGTGKVLHYDQYVHPRGYESVSFASVAFYR